MLCTINLWDVKFGQYLWKLVAQRAQHTATYENMNFFFFHFSFICSMCLYAVYELSNWWLCFLFCLCFIHYFSHINYTYLLSKWWRSFSFASFACVLSICMCCLKLECLLCYFTAMCAEKDKKWKKTTTFGWPNRWKDEGELEELHQLVFHLLAVFSQFSFHFFPSWLHVMSSVWILVVT